MTDLNNIMQQAQKMQEQMKKAQEELANKVVTGESGAGLVKVTMNGKHQVKKVEIDSSLREEEKEVLEDLIAAAVNAAVLKVTESSQSQFSGLAEGFNLPEGFKLPF